MYRHRWSSWVWLLSRCSHRRYDANYLTLYRARRDWVTTLSFESSVHAGGSDNDRKISVLVATMGPSTVVFSFSRQPPRERERDTTRTATRRGGIITEPGRLCTKHNRVDAHVYTRVEVFRASIMASTHTYVRYLHTGCAEQPTIVASFSEQLRGQRDSS